MALAPQRVVVDQIDFTAHILKLAEHSCQRFFHTADITYQRLHLVFSLSSSRFYRACLKVPRSAGVPLVDPFRSPLFRLLGFLRLPVNGLPIGFRGFRLLFGSLRHSTLCFLFRFGSRLVSVELFLDRRLLIRCLCDTLISVRTCRF